jgi:hypothetical protein
MIEQQNMKNLENNAKLPKEFSVIDEVSEINEMNLLGDT